jgi:uncharacterized membrane protein SirB2
MITYSIPSLIGAFVAIGLGVFVVHKRLKDKQSRVFFFLMLALAIWCFGEFMMQNCKNIYEALLWAKLANFGFVLIPTFLVRFAYVYPREITKESKFIYVLPAVLATLVIFTNTVFSVAPSDTPEIAFKCIAGDFYLFY